MSGRFLQRADVGVNNESIWTPRYREYAPIHGNRYPALRKIDVIHFCVRFVFMTFSLFLEFHFAEE